MTVHILFSVMGNHIFGNKNPKMIYFFLLIILKSWQQTKKTAAKLNIVEMCSFPCQTEDAKKERKERKKKHPRDASFSHIQIL